MTVEGKLKFDAFPESTILIRQQKLDVNIKLFRTKIKLNLYINDIT